MRKGTPAMIPEIKKILYATDLSKNASYAFFYAVDMARRNDAKIVILHSVEPGHNISYSGIDVENLMKEAKKEEQEAELEAYERGQRPDGCLPEAVEHCRDDPCA